MKIESIALRNTGPFTDAVSIGPLADGINVLTARNEAGKTTILVGAARALFDRHNVTGDAIERLRPAGTSLAPDVTVVFTTVEGRFRIHKTFLNSQASDLSEDCGGEWRPIAEGDAADAKVLELIGGERTARGASKAEHWGLLRYLWARQGESADWPLWDDGAGARIRSGLARVEIDPLVERLADQFMNLQAVQFTTMGRISKNSPLQGIHETRERLESELADVRAKMDELETQTQELVQVHDELATRARENSEAAQQAEALTETLKQVELLQKDLERYQSDFESAQDDLNTVHKEKERLNQAKADIDKQDKELTAIQIKETSAEEAERSVRQALATLQEEAKELQKKLDSARKREARLRDIQELRGTEQNLETLRKQLDAVRTQQQIVDGLRRKRSLLPDVSKRQVVNLEQLEQELRELVIRAEAVGMRIALTPRKDATIAANRDGNQEALELATGETTTLTATRYLRLDLPEWGALHIASGAEEAAEIERQIGERRSALDAELKKTGVDSIDGARAIVEQIKDLDREIKTAAARVSELLEAWNDPESLSAEVDKAEVNVGKLRAQLDMSATETALTQAELKAELAAVRTCVDADEIAWTAVQEAIEAEIKRLEECGAARSEAATAVNAIKNKIAALKSQAATILERYPAGIDKAEEDVQSAFVGAKAQLDMARKKMPADWEKIAARHERALQAAEQAAREHQKLQQRTQKIETLLEQAGSQGLYSRETRLQEALATTKAKGERLEDQAVAARFLTGLIDYRKKAAVNTVLKPLEDQLSATFADITGVLNRRVFLDENLQVIGIGRKHDEAYAFTQLSQGAREQLLLALRAAVALELAKTGPQILILDDVLVNTDATRQDNVLDFIGNIAQQVQVLIVTCHGERYRGIGTAIEIGRNERNP